MIRQQKTSQQKIIHIRERKGVWRNQAQKRRKRKRSFYWGTLKERRLRFVRWQKKQFGYKFQTPFRLAGGRSNLDRNKILV